MEVAEIYAIVEEMQERCIAMLGPGVRYLDASYLADRIAIEGLMRLGILKKAPVEELLRSGLSRIFFPHGLGHHMGLDVHDVSERPILSPCGGNQNSMIEYSGKGLLRRTKAFMNKCTSDVALLEPGMVITVEPGICMFKTTKEGQNADLEPQISRVTPWKQSTYPIQKSLDGLTIRYWNGICMLEE